jgi:hypothetical protein
MPLMPAFRRRRKDSAVVGRLIAGYGELEFLLAMCTGVALAARRKPNPKHTSPRHRIRYEHIGIERFFRIRGEQNRIDYAKKQMHKVFFKMGMRADYIEIMGAMATCLKIRNLFAHCHWGQSKKRGLFFIDLEAAGRARGRLTLNNFRHADGKTLAQVEDYFWYTFLCLDYLAADFSIRADLMRGPGPSRPTRPPSLKPLNLLFPLRSPH